MLEKTLPPTEDDRKTMIPPEEKNTPLSIAGVEISSQNLPRVIQAYRDDIKGMASGGGSMEESANLSDEQISQILKKSSIHDLGLNTLSILEYIYDEQNEVFSQKTLNKVFRALEKEKKIITPRTEIEQKTKIKQEFQQIAGELDQQRQQWKSNGKSDKTAGERLYIKIQNMRAALIKKPWFIIKWGSQAAQQADAVVNADEDYKVVRLIALLDRPPLFFGSAPNIDTNKKFRAAMQWLPSSDSEKLKYKYELITERRLETDLQEHFYTSLPSLLTQLSHAKIGKLLGKGKGRRLQWGVLKQLLDNGKVSPSIQFAIELNLLQRGVTPTSNLPLEDETKDKIRKFVNKHSGDLADLVDEAAMRKSKDEFLKAVYNYLKQKPRSNFLQELQGIIQVKLDTLSAENSRVAGSNMIRKTGNSNADYLTSLIYNIEKKRYRKLDELKVQRRILAHTAAMSSEERAKFLRAKTELTDKDVRESNNPYEVFWFLTRSPLLKMGPHWRKYTKKLIEAQDKDAALRNIYELDALLEYEASKPFLGFPSSIRKRQRAATRTKVLNLLSSSNTWIAKVALQQYYLMSIESEAFKELLKNAGLNDFDVKRVIQQVELRGAHEGEKQIDEKRKMDRYQDLKKEVSWQKTFKKYHFYPGRSILNILIQVELGSFDYNLIRRDEPLLAGMQAIVHRLLLPKKESKKETLWKMIATMLNLSEDWRSLTTYKNKKPSPFPPLFDDPEIKPVDFEIEPSKIEKHAYWAARMAIEYAIVSTERTTTKEYVKVLKVTFQAWLAGVKGTDLAAELQKIDSDLYQKLQSSSPLSPYPESVEQKSHQLLKEFLNGTKTELTVNDLFLVSEGWIKHDQDFITFFIDILTPDQALKLWFSESIGQLINLSEKRLKLHFNLLAKKLELGGTSKAYFLEEKNNLSVQLKQKDEEIHNFSINIDEKLKIELKKLTQSIAARFVEKTVDDKELANAKAAELEETLLYKVGQSFSNRTSEEIQNLKLTPAETARIGNNVRIKSDIMEKRRYESARIGWYRFNSAGTVVFLEMSKVLGILDQARNSLKTSTNLSEEPLQERLTEAENELKTALKKWKERQDIYQARLVTAVTSIVSFIVITAGLASGVAAAPALVQLAWALGTTAGQSLVRQGMMEALARTGEHDIGGDVTKILTDTIKATTNFFITNELTVAWELGMIRVGDINTHEAKFFSKPALAIPKEQLKKKVESLTVALCKIPFSAESAKPNLQEIFKLNLKEIPQGYLKGVTTILCDQLYNQITANGYDRTSDVYKLYGATEDESTAERMDRALGNILNFSNSLNEAAQFVGGPTDNMGASEWSRAPDINDPDWNKRLVNSLKTSIYEEIVIPKIFDGIEATLKSVFPQEDSSRATNRQFQQEDQEDQEKEDQEKVVITNSILELMIETVQRMGLSLNSNEPIKNVEDLIAVVLKETEIKYIDIKAILKKLEAYLKKKANTNYPEIQRQAIKEYEEILKELKDREKNPVRQFFKPTNKTHRHIDYKKRQKLLTKNFLEWQNKKVH